MYCSERKSSGEFRHLKIYYGLGTVCLTNDYVQILRADRFFCQPFAYLILFDKLEFVYLTITSIAVHLPLLQELSETLQAAIPSVTSTNASSTILLPAFESGAHTSMLPSALIFVYIKRFIGRMIGCDVQSALLMLSRQLEWS